jgi:3-methyladenine DNA glycosylase/8-oxoguanine DNA glycosylase
VPAPRPLETTVRPRLPVDLQLTLGALRRGRGDPCLREAPDGSWWRATRTPEGPATTWIRQRGSEVLVTAWGPGARWALEAAPELVGARDSLEGFRPGRGVVRELHRRMPGLRIPRSRAVFEALLATVVEQKVAGAESRRSYRELVLAWGEPAPGPWQGAGVAGLTVPPPPAALAATPYYRFHPFAIEMRRANTIRFAACHAARLETLADRPLEEAYRFLLALPGVGPWTAAEVALVALGDADAVSVGDYHLPHAVSWALAGEPRGSDERMLELLEPFAGHRGRVLRMIAAVGIRAPRFGPRMPLRSFRRF